MIFDRFSVLVVDDEEDMLAIIKSVLERNNYDVVTADNGLTAWETIKKRTGLFDLIITDMMMPKMDGFQLVDRMRKEKWDIPTIVMTAFGDKQAIINLLRRGVTDYLEKPIILSELMERVGIIKNAMTGKYQYKIDQIERKIYRKRQAADL